jgi:hypothetical protein
MHQYTVNSNIKMSQNQIQYQNQRAVRTCSCCGQQGHAINNCNSPQVLRFIEDATTTAAAITASSVEALKLRRPFTNTSLPVLKAVAANIRIESSVSNLTVDYLTHLLACFYWNKHNPAGSHANIRETSLSLFQLAETSRQAATNALSEQAEVRIQQQRIEAQQRQQAAAAAIADRNLQIFLRQQQRYASEHILIEDQRRRTRHAFIQARLPVPPSVAQPIAPAQAAPAQAAPLLCLCCNSAEHNIDTCKSYRGMTAMFKILAIVSSSEEFRTRLQQHPNLYTYLAFAIQGRFVPAECRDCVLAMNKITDYYYRQEKYVRIRTELEEYSLECEYQQLTGQALETNVIHDPRIGFYQSLIETTKEITFNNTNDQEFVAKCIRICDMINVNVNNRPIDITLGVKASAAPPPDEAKACAEQEQQEEQSCAVCLGAWDINYPTITFGCNHDMCARCLNTFFKTPTRPSCHLCRQPICHISVPSEALNAELFQDIGVRILRRRQSIIDLTI